MTKQPSRGQRHHQANRLRRIIGRNADGTWIYAPVALIAVRRATSVGGDRRTPAKGRTSRTPRGLRFRWRQKARARRPA